MRQSLAVLFLMLFAGCMTTGSKLADASTLSDAELRQFLVGHWYARAYADKGEPLLNWEETDYRNDGSCTYTLIKRSIDPQTNRWLVHRNPRFGHWEIAGRELIVRWNRKSFPHSTGMSKERILRVGTNQVEVQQYPFGSYLTYYRHLRIIRLNS
jgi:hypothetical protein